MVRQSFSGGVDKCVQIDETAWCRRRLIYRRLNEAPYTRDTKWVIGIHCEYTKRIELEVLEDRTVESIKDSISRAVLPGTIMMSDGYPS